MNAGDFYLTWLADRANADPGVRLSTVDYFSAETDLGPHVLVELSNGEMTMIEVDHDEPETVEGTFYAYGAMALALHEGVARG